MSIDVRSFGDKPAHSAEVVDLASRRGASRIPDRVLGASLHDGAGGEVRNLPPRAVAPPYEFDGPGAA